MIQTIRNHNSLTESGDSRQHGRTETGLEQARKDLLENIRKNIAGVGFSSEEERMKFQERIDKKIRMGAKLTTKEMSYLRQYSPYMYEQMVRVQKRREALKERLKHCRTKEEAQMVSAEAMSSIREDDPAKEALAAAIRNVSEQFFGSEAYRRLPETIEDLKRKKRPEEASENPFREDEEDEGEDGIEYSVSPSGYQMAVMPEISGGQVFAVQA